MNSREIFKQCGEPRNSFRRLVPSALIRTHFQLRNDGGWGLVGEGSEKGREVGGY